MCGGVCPNAPRSWYRVDLVALIERTYAVVALQNDTKASMGR